MMNTKLTNILLIILLLFNVAFLGTWWLGHHRMHHPPKKGPEAEASTLLLDQDKGGMFLVKTLGLDTLQQKKLDNLLQAHFVSLHENMDAYVRNQLNFFNSLKNNDSTYAFRCADSMGMLKVKMEKEFYKHLMNIKNICNSGQQKQFEEFTESLSKEFVRHHDVRSSGKTSHDSL